MSSGSDRGTHARPTLCALGAAALLLVGAICGRAQDAPQERTFSQSKPAVEKALKSLQPFTAGRIPILDGFARPGNLPMDRFQRAYYQCTVEVLASGSAGSLVRVRAKITAWYTDRTSSGSGYRALPSNGRLETDLLDRLSDALGESPSAFEAGPPSRAPSPVAHHPATAEPVVSAPMPRLPASSLYGGLQVPTPGSDPSASLEGQTEAAEKRERDLASEAKGLEEILENQSHPDNLAAVKKTGTPVLESAKADAPVLFAATAGDEFEILDTSLEWVHVRISGLSRGWIRRASLEMPGDQTVERQAIGGSRPIAAAAFHVTAEQFAPFPGDWVALRGKTVKIVSVQKTNENAKDPGPQARLEFAKALFTKEYPEASLASDGIVLIFDSEDGGMVAAALPSLQQWKVGTLSDEAFWRQCFFDPPEAFTPSANR
jgi:hypothetical protein